MLFRKKTYQIGLMAIAFACGSLFATSAVLAQAPPNPDEYKLEVEFEQTPLFGNEEGNFLPGDNVIRWVKVTNNTEQVQKIATEAINYFGFPEPDDVPSDDLSRAMLIVIREKNNVGGYTDIYGTPGATGVKTLFDFYKNGETYLSDIVATIGSVNEYEFEISFPESKGDNWQGTTTKFDIVVGFQGGESVNNGDLPPGLIIKNVRVYDITSTSAKFSWFTSYNATSRVIYCEETENCVLDLSDNADSPPLYGYEYTTNEMHTPASANGVMYRGEEFNEIGIAELIPGTVYSYRAISHASPPTISRSHTFTTLAMGDDMDNSDDDTNGSTQDSQPWVEVGANNEDGETYPNYSQEGNNTGQENGANDAGDGANEEKESGLISSVGNAINSMGNFIGSALGGVNKTEEDIVNSNKEFGSKIKSSSEGSMEQILLFAILLFLAFIILLYCVYQLGKKKDKV